jgi:hypothetical protein
VHNSPIRRVKLFKFTTSMLSGFACVSGDYYLYDVYLTEVVFFQQDFVNNGDFFIDGDREFAP